MDLGELAARLSKVENLTATVYVNNKVPRLLNSYRGYYDECAIDCSVGRKVFPDVPTLDTLQKESYGYQPSHFEVALPEFPTVNDLIAGIELTYFEDFEGYKGGGFTFFSSTRVWESGYGECSGNQIVNVEDLGDRVDVVTVYDRGW